MGVDADPVPTVSSKMSDVDEITALINEYAFRLDAGDLDGVAALLEHAELGSTHGMCGRLPSNKSSTVRIWIFSYLPYSVS